MTAICIQGLFQGGKLAETQNEDAILSSWFMITSEFSHPHLVVTLLLVLKLSPLVPGLTTPTAELDEYPVSELVPCCFPLARDMCVGGAVGRLKILVGWLSC